MEAATVAMAWGASSCTSRYAVPHASTTRPAENRGNPRDRNRLVRIAGGSERRRKIGGYLGDYEHLVRGQRLRLELSVAMQPEDSEWLGRPHLIDGAAVGVDVSAVCARQGKARAKVEAVAQLVGEPRRAEGLDNLAVSGLPCSDWKRGQRNNRPSIHRDQKRGSSDAAERIHQWLLSHSNEVRVAAASPPSAGRCRALRRPESAARPMRPHARSVRRCPCHR
eukprot:7169690-Prymnesium_polylepis.2